MAPYNAKPRGCNGKTIPHSPATRQVLQYLRERGTGLN